MTAKKKLLITTDSFMPRIDGVSVFLSKVIPLLSNNYEISVLAPNFKGTEEFRNNARVTRFPIYNFNIADIQIAKVNRKILKEEIQKADIVWAQTIGPIGGFSIYYAHKLKKPLFSYIHSIERELFSKSMPSKLLRKIIYLLTGLIAKYLYNKCDALMVPFEDIAKDISAGGIKSKKIVVHLGVNSDYFVPAKNKIEAKKRIGIDPKNKIILYVGRIGREKDLKTLAKAFLRIKKRFHNAVLLIVGEGLESIKKQLSSKRGIILVGQKRNVLVYYQAADVYVLPSLTETTSLTTMEAMSCELAVIVTKVGFVKQYVIDKQNGFVFPTGNDYILFRKLEMLFQNPGLRSRLGYYARETIKEHYTWDRTVKKIKEVLESY